METPTPAPLPVADSRRRATPHASILRLCALRGSDLDAVRRFLARVHPDDKRLRFHGVFAAERAAIELASHDGRSRWALAVVASTAAGRDDVLAILNVARVGERGEWALLVRSDLKGRGLGTLLLDELVRRAPRMGLNELFAETFPDNDRLLGLARRFGHRSARVGSVVELSRRVEAGEPADEMPAAIGVSDDFAAARAPLH
jgi:acetyltransferase